MLIGVTMGDPNGIGPEIILNSFQKGEIRKDLVVIGDYQVMDFCNRLLQYQVPLNRIGDLDQKEEGKLNVFDLGLLGEKDIEIGKVSSKAGFAAKKYVEYAVSMALDGKISALVTLPVNKKAVRLTDPHFTGHTEFIAQLCGQFGYAMMLASEKLTVAHVTTHISLSQVAKSINQGRIVEVINLAGDAMQMLLGREPKIAVSGLNPHAGEDGAFGREEIEEIAPAVKEARNQGWEVEGPLSPDTVFLKAYRGEYDVVVAMYHDQGHIPVKLLDFEGGVNVTLGLKVIRTSVDHGTAFDIAYKGVANTKSFVQAFSVAEKLSKQKGRAQDR